MSISIQILFVLLWAVTLFATFGSLYMNAQFLIRPHEYRHQDVNSIRFDMTACLGWALLIVFWWH